METGNITIFEAEDNFKKINKELIFKCDVLTIGVFTKIMLLGKQWQLNINGLRKILGLSDDKVRKSIQELENYGFVRRTPIKLENGQFRGYNYEFHSEPVPEEMRTCAGRNEVIRHTDFGLPGNTGTQFSVESENGKPIYKDNINTETNKEKEDFINSKIVSDSRNQTKSAKIDFDLSFVDWRLSDAFIGWLEYKKGRRQAYKTQKSLELCYKRLIEMADLDIDVARQIIEQSIANNYAGLFPLKNNGYGNSNSNNQSNGNYSGGANAQNSGAFYRNLRDQFAGSL